MGSGWWQPWSSFAPSSRMFQGWPELWRDGRLLPPLSKECQSHWKCYVPSLAPWSAWIRKRWASVFSFNSSLTWGQASAVPWKWNRWSLQFWSPIRPSDFGPCCCTQRKIWSQERQGCSMLRSSSTATLGSQHYWGNCERGNSPRWSFGLTAMQNSDGSSTSASASSGFKAWVFRCTLCGTGGASHDVLSRRRSLLEVKQRGRWSSDASLKRYVKEARLQSELNKVPKHVKEAGLHVLHSLPSLLRSLTWTINMSGIQKLTKRMESKVPRSKPFRSLTGADLLKRYFRDARRKASHKHYGVFLDLFCGDGGVGHYLHKHGFPVISIDILNDPRLDLTDSRVLQVINGWIRSGCVFGIWFGTPCTTWSRARHGPVGSSWDPLRDNQHIYGIPGLSSHDQHKIRVGNRTMTCTARLIRLCCRFKVPCFLENPSGSMMWLAPPILRLCHHSESRCCVCDFCQYGARWRKRTRIQTWNAPELPSLNHTCHGHKGICSRTHKHHIVLKGQDPVSKQLWTQIAQPYPKTVCCWGCQSLNPQSWVSKQFSVETFFWHLIFVRAFGFCVLLFQLDLPSISAWRPVQLMAIISQVGRIDSGFLRPFDLRPFLILLQWPPPALLPFPDIKCLAAWWILEMSTSWKFYWTWLMWELAIRRSLVFECSRSPPYTRPCELGADWQWVLRPFDLRPFLILLQWPPPALLPFPDIKCLAAWWILEMSTSII